MTLIALSQPINFPTSAVRALLRAHIPQFRWQCGDGDMQGENESASFDRPQLIMGVGNPDVIMVEARRNEGLIGDDPSVPTHECHIRLSLPTTEDPLLSNQIRFLIAAGLVIDNDDDAHVRFLANGRWWSVANIREAVDAIKAGRFAAVLDEMVEAPVEAELGPGTAPSLAWDRDRDSPPPYANEDIRTNKLPTLVALLDGPVAVHWNDIADALGNIDPYGGWVAEGDSNGRGQLVGHAGTIRVEPLAQPAPAKMIAEAGEQSMVTNRERERMERHQTQLILTSKIDTRQVPYDDVRSVALAMSLTAAAIAEQSGTAGLYTVGAEKLVDRYGVPALLAKLADGEVPPELWAHIHWDSLSEERVSGFTTGFAPFFGYELEITNAPVDPRFAEVKLADMIRYLLAKGPVIHSGDSFGIREDDREIRCRMADSRIDRRNPVFAMNIEFQGASQLSEPKPDDRRMAADFMPQVSPPVRGFGRKGL